MWFSHLFVGLQIFLMHTDIVFETINVTPKLKMPKFPKDISSTFQGKG